MPIHNPILKYAAITAASLSIFIPTLSLAEEVNIYSYRQPELIAPLLEKFENETGIKANVQYLKTGLVERIQAEGENSPADLIMTVDIARITQTKIAGVTQQLDNEIIEANIPAQYRDKDNYWFGLTMRGRVVYAAKDRVSQDSITYEELADPKWKGRICLRSGQHVYNIALISSMIAHLGEEEAKEWLIGLRDNLARKPDGNDRAQAKGIFSGECDLGIGNTYYVGLMKNNDKNPEQKEWYNSMKVLFPNQNDRGTHVNLSAVALAKYAPNKENAIKLMEFLSSKEAQEIYAEQVYEYPLIESAEASEDVKSFGTLKADAISLNIIAENRSKASKMVDEVGFNAGAQN